jgi:amphi-Trp domain-containing protein
LSDIEKTYSSRQIVSKLRRLADALEKGTSFQIQIGGERVVVPPRVVVELEYERVGDEEEIEIELRWTRR